MTGVYPDVPSKRLAWDRDGSQFYYWNGSTVTTRSLAERQAQNDENAATEMGVLFSGGMHGGVIFPDPTTIVGYYIMTSGNGGNMTDEYSLDTTTGIDGTWSTLRASFSTSGDGAAIPAYRNLIQTGAPMPVANVKAIRRRCISITGNQRFNTIHIYGYRTAATNRLELWHPTLDQPLHQTPALGDFGDQPRAIGYKTLSFRVKNLSATLTAQTITVVREMMTDGSPTILGLTDLRYDGGSYGTTAAVGNLAPGAISNIVDARLNITATAPIGPWTERFVAAAASWA